MAQRTEQVFPPRAAGEYSGVVMTAAIVVLALLSLLVVLDGNDGPA